MSQPKLDRKELELISWCIGEVLMFSKVAKNDKQLETIKKRIARALTPIKVSSRKGKGRQLQQFICRDIAELLGLTFNQQDDACLIHSREMGQAGIDIVLRGEAKKMFPFSIECKNTESFSLYPTIEQACNNASPETDWLVVHKKKGSEPIVVMDWKAFTKWYSRKGYLLSKGE